MVYVKQNTEKLKNCGKEVITLASSYEKLVNDIFKKIESIESAWVGEDAEQFMMRVKSEQDEYRKFGLLLKQYGKSLMDASDNLDKIAVENKIQ